MARVAVMGAGSWGTAFGMILCDAGGDVVLWAREPEVQESINLHHRNDLFHPGVEFPEQMTEGMQEAAVETAAASTGKSPISIGRKRRQNGKRHAAGSAAVGRHLYGGGAGNPYRGRDGHL